GVVASCGEDGLVVWWDVKDGWPVASKPNAHPPKRPEGVYGTVPNGVLDAAFGPSGELATCGRDGKIKLWSAKGKEEKSFAIPDDAPAGVTIVPTRVAISFDGKAVLAGDSAGRLHTWPSR
ncbi:MAG: WD40 repeat domain-containing protein, partial [Planctomycetia bacterium]|nr:WD40 repeat domain-containing protein [Planctomycetia bacterium]